MSYTIRNFINIIVLSLSILFVSSPEKTVKSKEQNHNYSSLKKILIQKDTVEIKSINENLFKSGLLYDVEKDKIVWSKNLNQQLPIASVSKMMVALITIEDIKSGKINLSDKVSVSREATLVGGSSVFLRRGSKHSIEELLNASLIASGNDACYTLAYSNSGSERNFVNRMNQRACELGMSSTKFSNCTGMPDRLGKDNRSTSIDLLILALEIMKYDEIERITSKPVEVIHNGKRKFIMNNHNRLVKQFSDINGIKTGWTRKAGSCIVVTTSKSKYQMISIILGARSSQIRNLTVSSMINEYFQKSDIQTLTKR